MKCLQSSIFLPTLGVFSSLLDQYEIGNFECLIIANDALMKLYAVVSLQPYL